MSSLERPRYLSPGLNPQQFPPVPENFWGQLFQHLWDYWGDPYWWPGQDAWEVAVGAVLTQNTTWTNVEKALVELRSRKLTTPPAILGTARAELAPIIRSAGYFNQKAKKLHALAELWLSESFKQRLKLLSGTGNPDFLSVQSMRDSLLQVWGVGPETADSVSCYSLGLPVFVVDKYTQRMLARVNGTSILPSYCDVQEDVHTSLPRDTMLFNHLHGLIVNLGKDICTARVTHCDRCPLNEMCASRV